MAKPKKKPKYTLSERARIVALELKGIRYAAADTADSSGIDAPLAAIRKRAADRGNSK